MATTPQPKLVGATSAPCVLYQRDGFVARITLNRPERLNAINDELPPALAAAVERANADPEVHVITVSGSGRGFCSGYDLKDYAERPRPCPGSQEMPWDPMVDFHFMNGNTQHFMSLWRSHKPTIAKVHGVGAIAGGSDIALCADFVVMSETARIGYPPARVWGVPTTAMWVFRLGPEKAKRMMLTGDLISGREAAAMGLVLASFPEDELDARVGELESRIGSVPVNQLAMCKQVVNTMVEAQGLSAVQRLANVYDGVARHSPEGVEFKNACERVGFHGAVASRDTAGGGALGPRWVARL